MTRTRSPHSSSRRAAAHRRTCTTPRTPTGSAQVDAKGLLAKVDPATLANVPVQDSGLDHNWVGVTARISCMIYNTKLVSAAQLPRSIMELGSTEWAGKLGVDSGETDFWPLVDAVYQRQGSTSRSRG